MTASDSPCLYSSTNPWKVTSEFKAVSHTREEYVKVIEELKAKAPTKTKRLAKFEISHINLIQALENRLEAIDAELAVSDTCRSMNISLTDLCIVPFFRLARYFTQLSAFTARAESSPENRAERDPQGSSRAPHHSDSEANTST